MNDPYEMEPHSFGSLKGISGICCKYCGLVKSNNLLTDFAIKHGCHWADHPRASWAIQNLPKQWVERHERNRNP